MTSSLYGDLKAAGVPMMNRESDLYFQDTPQAREILAKFPYSEKISQRFAESATGEPWLEVPFAYLPWWERRVEFARDLVEPGDLKD